jgi:hypothetical protein
LPLTVSETVAVAGLAAMGVSSSENIPLKWVDSPDFPYSRLAPGAKSRRFCRFFDPGTRITLNRPPGAGQVD